MGNLGNTTTTASTLPAAGSGAKSGAGSGTGYSQALASAQCLRSHGVPEFPDPTSNGSFPRDKASQSQLLAAEDSCQHLLPNGGQPSQALQQ